MSTCLAGYQSSLSPGLVTSVCFRQVLSEFIAAQGLLPIFLQGMYSVCPSALSQPPYADPAELNSFCFPKYTLRSKLAAAPSTPLIFAVGNPLNNT